MQHAEEQSIPLQTDADVVRIRFSQVAAFLKSRHVVLRHLERHPDETMVVVKNLALEPYASIYRKNIGLYSIGAFSYSNGPLSYGITIGRYCSIGKNLSFFGADHFSDWISTSPRFYLDGFHDFDGDVSDRGRRKRRVVIGNDVWIGANVTLKNNLRIGDGAIVASNSVVTKDVPPFTIVGGVPARIIRPRFSGELQARIEGAKWWQYKLLDLKNMRANDPHDFLELLEAKVAMKLIEPYRPALITEQALLAEAQKSVSAKDEPEAATTLLPAENR